MLVARFDRTKQRAYLDGIFYSTIGGADTEQCGCGTPNRRVARSPSRAPSRQRLDPHAVQLGQLSPAGQVEPARKGDRDGGTVADEHRARRRGQRAEQDHRETSEHDGQIPRLGKSQGCRSMPFLLYAYRVHEAASWLTLTHQQQVTPSSLRHSVKYAGRCRLLPFRSPSEESPRGHAENVQGFS